MSSEPTRDLGVLEANGRLSESRRYHFNRRGVDGVHEVPANARKVDWPRHPEFGHARRGESCDIAPGVGGTHGLRHEPPRCEIVDQSGDPARRQICGPGQIGHPQLAVRRLGEVHDRRVLTGGQAGPSD